MGAQSACSCVCTAKFISCDGRRFERQQWRLSVLNYFTFGNKWSLIILRSLAASTSLFCELRNIQFNFPSPHCWNRVCAFILMRAAGRREWRRLGKLCKGSFQSSWGKARSVYSLWAGAMQPLGRSHWSNQFGLAEAKCLSAGLISFIPW